MMDLFGAENVHIQNKQKQPCRTTEIEKLRKQRARTYQKAKNREISKQTISKLQLHKHLAPSAVSGRDRRVARDAYYQPTRIPTECGN